MSDTEPRGDANVIPPGEAQPRPAQASSEPWSDWSDVEGDECQVLQEREVGLGLWGVPLLGHEPTLDLIHDEEDTPARRSLGDVLGGGEVAARVLESVVAEGVEDRLPQVVHAGAVGLRQLVHREQDNLDLAGWCELDLMLCEPPARSLGSPARGTASRGGGSCHCQSHPRTRSCPSGRRQRRRG